MSAYFSRAEGQQTLPKPYQTLGFQSQPRGSESTKLLFLLLSSHGPALWN